VTGPIHDRAFAELDAATLHDLLRLRVDVFVVEQDCPYPELDGRDVEPTARHLWLADDRGPIAYLRLLDEGAARRIGRVVTRADARGQGLAGRLVDHVVVAAPGPWVLDAQSHLQGWYEARGFVVTGPEYLEDGIPHVPMRRDGSAPPR
jgi:ElaA protein